MPPLPMPDTPQMSARLAVVIVSFEGENGICTSQRTPAFSVSVGVTRHESCANAEKTSSLPARRRRPEVHVLVRLGIERRQAGDRDDAAGQQRVELARVGQLRAGRALEVRRW